MRSKIADKKPNAGARGGQLGVTHCGVGEGGVSFLVPVKVFSCVSHYPKRNFQSSSSTARRLNTFNFLSLYKF